MNDFKVGLVLGSGSSRGWAHIGAIEALQDANIPIDLVTGCSVGALSVPFLPVAAWTG